MSDGPAMPLTGTHAPPLRCGRLAEFPDESTQCPNDATWHIFWTDDLENTIDCDQHKAEAERYKHVAIHPYRMQCSMPGTRFIEEENRCEVDEGSLGLAQAELVSLTTPSTLEAQQ